MLLIIIFILTQLSIIWSFVLGYKVGKKQIKIPNPIKRNKIKVLQKSVPKTHVEMRGEAIKKGKSMIKVFEK